MNQIDFSKCFRFFDPSLDLLSVVGFDGYIKQLNPAWETTTGFTCAELTAKPLLQFIHPDNQAPFQQLTAVGSVSYFEGRFICKNGALKWFSWRVTSFPAEQLIYMVTRDITVHKQAQLSAHYRLQLEKLITTLSTQFITLSPGEIDLGINQALQTIGQISAVDRSYIFIFSTDGVKMDNTHEWCAAGVEPQIERLQGLPLNDFLWLAEKMRQHEIVYIPRVTDLPQELAARDHFLQQDIQSLINIPMFHHDSLVGFFGLDSVRAERAWGEEDIGLFKIIAEMFVNALERKQTEQREALAYEFGRHLTTMLNPDMLLAEIVNRLQQTFGYYHAHVYLFNKTFPSSFNPRPDEAELLVVREGTGAAGLAMKQRGHTIPLNTTHSLVARAARSLQPVIVNDVRQNPDHLPNPLLPDTNSEAAIPLFLGQRLIGVLDVQHTLVNHFDIKEERTLQIVASQLSVALSNAQLFEQNAHRLAIIENASNLIALISLTEYLIIYINPAGAALAGYNRPEELIGQPLAHFYQPADWQRIANEGMSTAAPQNIWRGESNLRRTDESLLPIDQTIFIISDELGQPQMWATIMTDITERKQAELVLQKINEELEIRVTERTTALTRQTQELARSNADLEQFAYVASHDLQEPLRMITSYVQLLARRYRGQLDADADDFIGYAVDGAIRMQQLINDLLTYSRVGRQGGQFEPTDCQAVLKQVLHNLGASIQEHGAVITYDPLPVVMADSLQLEQLLQNLLSNALKFHGETPPQIHLTARLNNGLNQTALNTEWVFAVRDNGIGISPEYIERIFIIFQRLHARHEYPGTGIGLAVCKKIVERHQGRIWVESQPGQGSTFYFSLPATRLT